MSVKQIIDAVEKVSGSKIKVEYSERRAGDQPALYADSTLAKELLGWELQYKDVEAIVASAWKWHSRHPEGFAD